ncbi:hypothetical protein [Streptomyces flavalbus]|uniref:Secreted protein n=1 Tax=Streptomyces flavalbus TaxID=2665155 RepID=A0ABW2W848_9ACTN
MTVRMTVGMTVGMTHPRARGTVAALALVLTLGGCGSGWTVTGGEGGPGSAAPAAPTAPSLPAATGTGPYPSPSGPAEASPVPTAAPGTPRVDVPRPADVDQEDADAVARGALTVLWTFDTVTDGGPHDAGFRAADAGWLTPAYARRLRDHQPRSVPGAQWREWAGHRAVTEVTLERAADAAIPPDSDTEAWRQWTVTASPRGRAGWTGDPSTVVAYVRLTRAAAGTGWRVADVAVQ